MFTLFDLEALCSDDDKLKAFLSEYECFLGVRLAAVVLLCLRSGAMIGALPIGDALIALAIVRFMANAMVFLSIAS